MNWDLNCDLGEGEPSRRTAALMRCVTSANIACGGHAGDVSTMRFAVRAARRLNIRVGAHPGLCDPAGFGRGRMEISTELFETLLMQQISALATIAKAEGVVLHHVKLHGALYQMVESEMALRKAYVSLLRKYWPGLIVFTRAGGRVIPTARKAGLQVWPEGFLDRGYLADGSLIPREASNALLSRAAFTDRIDALRKGSAPFPFPVRTWCLHSDTPHALDLARIARRTLIRGAPGRKTG